MVLQAFSLQAGEKILIPGLEDDSNNPNTIYIYATFLYLHTATESAANA